MPMNARFSRNHSQTFRLAVCLVILLAGGTWPHFALAQAPGLQLDSFEAVYEAKVLLLSGNVRLGVRRDPDGGYFYEYSVQAHRGWDYVFSGVLNETTTFTLDDGRPRPDEYRLLNTMGSRPRNGDYQFDWEQNRILGRYKEPEIDLPIEPDTVDRALLQLVLMHDVRNDDLKPEYHVFDRDEVKTFAIQESAGERISLPYGSYDTVVIRHTDDEASNITTLWLAPALDYLIVKVEQERDGRKMFEAELRQLMILF